MTGCGGVQLETIGDAFMCAGGVPDAMTPAQGACAAADMALDMIEVSAGVCEHEETDETDTFSPATHVLTGCRGHAEHAPFRHVSRPGASNQSGAALGAGGGRRHRA